MLAPVFEVTSRSSRLTDLGTKRATYEMLGVEEYYAFDPLKEYIAPGLTAFRLEGEDYKDITPNFSKKTSTPIRVYSPRLDLQAPAGETLGILLNQGPRYAYATMRSSSFRRFSRRLGPTRDGPAPRNRELGLNDMRAAPKFGRYKVLSPLTLARSAQRFRPPAGFWRAFSWLFPVSPLPAPA